jgi:hypothetical protein
MDDESFDPQVEGLVPRDPTLRDLVELCRELQHRGASFLVVGGFALRASGLNRNTADIDILIDSSLENEAKVFAALATLPDGCVRELDAGDVGKYTVVRVADEILIDLMASASGIQFAEASQSIIHHEIDGVRVPFASPELLYRMKKRANREKDRGDIYFLEQLFAARGKLPPRDV